jgi:hypothetical protein
MFTPNPEDELPPRWPSLDHNINLKPNALSVSLTKLIQLPSAHQELAHQELAHQELAQKFIDDDLKAGLICPSNSSYAAPLFFIPKHDGTIRPVLDYRWVNLHTVWDKYPLPWIDDIIDQLQGSEHFTKLNHDVRWGFKNVRCCEASGSYFQWYRNCSFR